MASQSVATLPSASYAERARKGRNTAPIAGLGQDPLPSIGAFATSQSERAIPRGALELPNSTHSTSEAFLNDPAAHATAPSANVWITRTQQHRSFPPSETPSTTTSTLSASQTPLSISRSSSRKSRSRTDHPSLNDANAWPEVGEAIVPVPSRSEKDTPEGSTSASSQRKEKTKWVHVPPSELQEALDANRTHRPRSHLKSHAQNQSQSQSRTHSSPSQSLNHSVRSSPHLNARSRPLPEENSSHDPNFTYRLPPAPLTSSTSPHPPDAPRPSFDSQPNRRREPHRRRPSPSKSQPVGGWTFGFQTQSPAFKPLFGSFDNCLTVNSTPTIGNGNLELDANREQTPPADVERVTKQRGKFGIGIEQPDDQSDGHSTIGQDQDGWFVVDMNVGRKAKLPRNQPGIEFGQFGRSGTPRQDGKNSPKNINGVNQIGAYTGNRRASLGEAISNAVGVPGYRYGSYSQGSGGGRRGGRGGPRGTYSGNRSNGYPRSSISSSPYRSLPPPLVQSGYLPPFDVIDPFAPPVGNEAYHPYYLSPTSPSYPSSLPYGAPYAGPYGPYPTPMGAPGGVYGPAIPNGSVVPPPIPMPVTQPSFPLDALRFYLLGQVEYYFSVQNLAADLFLRRQMDIEGWIDITIIASFNRVQRLTQDINLVRDTMTLSSLLEVSGDKVRLANRRWEDFVLPANLPSSIEQRINPIAPQPFSTASGSTLTSDDAATIQAKVTAAVLGNKSSMFQIAEVNGISGEMEKHESSSNATVGSFTTSDAAPTLNTSSFPSSLGGNEEAEKRLTA